MLADLSEGKGFKGDDPYVPEAYDASALILLAMQAANSTDPAVYKDKIMMVANAPGEKIFPGELKKALQILADGGDVDVGGTALELIEPGESAGSFRESEVKGGEFTTVQYH
jgi:branched-chain amino acid transport system substrate-binding protein